MCIRDRYTRIIKTGYRLGDNAEMCVIELVDYNALLLVDTKDNKTKSRRRRRKKSSSSNIDNSSKNVKVEKKKESKKTKDKKSK